MTILVLTDTVKILKHKKALIQQAGDISHCLVMSPNQLMSSLWNITTNVLFIHWGGGSPLSVVAIFYSYIQGTKKTQIGRF